MPMTNRQSLARTHPLRVVTSLTSIVLYEIRCNMLDLAFHIEDDIINTHLEAEQQFVVISPRLIN